MYRAVADRFLQIRGEGMHRFSRLLIPERMVAVTPNGPFRALGVRSHGKGTFSRIDALAAVEEFGKTVYRVEPNRFIVNIVFAWEGAAAITSAADSGCLVSHRFPTFRINEQLLDIEYFRHVIRTKPFRQLLALASPGGAGRNKTLNRDDLLKFMIHVPPLSEQRAVAETLNSLDRRISLLNRHISALARQRDALATQLLTGRLPVPNAHGAAELGD
jgi:type I restriction enzyme S subunit